MEALKVEKAIAIGNWCDGNEAKGVTLAFSQNNVAIEEAQAGLLVQEFYGQTPYLHRVVLSTKDAFVLGLGDREKDLVSGLQKLFNNGAFLSDMLDLCDKKQVPFTYEVWDKNRYKWCAV